jgi:protein archease
VIKYEYIDNIAPSDCAFKAYGSSLEELFYSSALAVTASMVVPESVNTNHSFPIELKEENLSDLLYSWLEEIVYLKDAESLFLIDFDIKISANTTVTLNAMAHGDLIDYEKQKILVDVKAVTMHKFSIQQTKDGWEAFVILDL